MKTETLSFVWILLEDYTESRGSGLHRTSVPHMAANQLDRPQALQNRKLWLCRSGPESGEGLGSQIAPTNSITTYKQESPRLILQVWTPKESFLIFIGRDGTGTSQASWQKSCSRQHFVVPTVLIDSLLDDECDLLLVWLYRKYSAVIGN